MKQYKKYNSYTKISKKLFYSITKGEHYGKRRQPQAQ